MRCKAPTSEANTLQVVVLCFGSEGGGVAAAEECV